MAMADAEPLKLYLAVQQVQVGCQHTLHQQGMQSALLAHKCDGVLTAAAGTLVAVQAGDRQLVLIQPPLNQRSKKFMSLPAKTVRLHRELECRQPIRHSDRARQSHRGLQRQQLWRGRRSRGSPRS